MASVEEPEPPYVSVERLLGLYKPRKKKVSCAWMPMCWSGSGKTATDIRRESIARCGE
jgi:hypothetical protein